MLSTEFLLYLVTMIFVVYVIMQYFKDDDSDKRRDGYRMREMEEHRMHMQGQGQGQGQMGAGSQQPVQQPVGRKNPQRVNVQVNNQDGMGGPVDPLRKFDYDAMYDELTPPFRRSYYDYDYVLGPGLYPTYSRGPPGRFRKVGTLIAQGVSNQDKYKFLNLLGREKYPGRDYEYYCTSVDSDSKLKIYIDTKGKEIRDGDTVVIPELAGYSYLFKEDRDLSPLYDPYIV